MQNLSTVLSPRRFVARRHTVAELLVLAVVSWLAGVAYFHDDAVACSSTTPAASYSVVNDAQKAELLQLILTHEL